MSNSVHQIRLQQIVLHIKMYILSDSILMHSVEKNTVQNYLYFCHVEMYKKKNETIDNFRNRKLRFSLKN